MPRCASSKGSRRAPASLRGRCPRASRSARTGSPTASTSRRPEDRLLPRPARQSPPRARARARPARAQRVLLHGRLHAGGARGRRGERAVDRQLRRRARRARDNLARNRRFRPSARRGSKPTCSRNCAACATPATFDLIVLDPPKFAPTAAHAERAARAYKDINLLALKLLRAGGLLATFSCSGGVSTRPLPEDRRGRGGRRESRREDRRALGRKRRPSGRAGVSRRRVPQGLLLRKTAERRELRKNEAAAGCPVRPRQTRPDGQEVARPCSVPSRSAGCLRQPLRQRS